MNDKITKFTPENIAKLRKDRGGPWVFQDTRDALTEIERLQVELATRDALIERLIEDYVTHYERDEFGEVKTYCVACLANDNETESIIHETTCPVAKWELLTHKSLCVSLNARSETQNDQSQKTAQDE